MSWTCKRGVGKLSTRVHSLPHLACVGEEKKEQRKRKRNAGRAGRQAFLPPTLVFVVLLFLGGSLSAKSYKVFLHHE